ncbi:hypothetical protein LINGRAHAP2_LOCUS17911, partial [Linum grandiflorum]
FRPIAQQGALHSLLSLHFVVSSTYLTSCLRAYTSSLRSSSHGMLCRVNQRI